MPEYDEQKAQAAASGGNTTTQSQTEQTGGDAATAQSTEVAGGKNPDGTPKEGQSAETKEAERAAAAKKDWEAFLGKFLGGKAFELIHDNLSYEDLLKYAEQATSAMAKEMGSLAKPTKKGAAGGLMDEQSEADAVNKLLTALAPAVKAAVDKWLESDSGKKVLTAIGQWVEGHPRTVTISAGSLAIGAAVAAYLTNMDPKEFETKFKLTSWLKGGVGLDVGPLQSWTIQAASASLEVNAGGFTGSIKARHEVEGGKTTIEGQAGYQNGGFKANATGKHDTSTGNTTVGGGASYENGGFKASATGQHETGTGKTTVGGSVGYDSANFTAGASATSDSEKGLSGNAHIGGKGTIGKQTKAEARADGEMAGDKIKVKLHGGLETAIGGKPLSVGADVTGTKEGAERVSGVIKLGPEGNQHQVEGWREQDGSYGLNFSRSWLSEEGVSGNLTQSLSGGKDGVTSKRDASLNFGQGKSLNVGDSQGPAGSGYHLGYKDNNLAGTGANLNLQHANEGGKSKTDMGLGLDKGALSLQLNAHMEQGLNTLGFKGKGNLSDNVTLEGDARYNFDASQFDQFGAKLGWKDPNSFRGFALEYRANWLKEHAGYEHAFDAAFEYSVGNLAGRLKAGVELQGSQMQKGDVDLLAGYKINKDWTALAGANYQKQFAGGGSDQFSIRTGVQYKDVAVTVDYTPKTSSFGVKLEVALWRW